MDSHGNSQASVRRGSPIFVYILAFICALLLLLSDQFLTSIGVYYTLEGGSRIEKFHISTYLLLLTFLAFVFYTGDPVGRTIRLAQLRPAYVTYLGALLLLIVYLTALQGTSGIAFVIDTLTRPVVLALLILALAQDQKRMLFRVVIGIIILNSLVGVFEATTSSRLVPYTIQGYTVYESHFRATALLGHPLNNAIITATALPFALSYPKSAAARSLATIILILGLLAFGGRTALGVGLFFTFVILCYRVGRDLSRGQFKLSEGALLAGTVLLGPILVGAVVATTNVGSRILGRLSWGSSADVRVESLNIFRLISNDELFFGMSGQRLEQLTSYLSNVETIENFWIILIARMGLIGFFVFLIGFALFCYQLMREERFPTKAAVLMFLIIASGNNSLASKSLALCVLVVLVMCCAGYAIPASRPNVNLHPSSNLARGAIQRNARRRYPASRTQARR